MKYPKDVQCNLAQILKQKKMSQLELSRRLQAKGLKTTHALVNKYCKGLFIPSWPTRIILCRLLEVPYSRMFKPKKNTIAL